MSVIGSVREATRDHISGVAIAIGSFSIGALVGVLFCAPIFGWELTDGASNLVGAAFGSGIAIAGSIWFSSHQQRKATRDSASYLMATITPASIACKALSPEGLKDLAGVRFEDGPDAAIRSYFVYLERVGRTLETTLQKIEQARLMFMSLGIQITLQFHIVESEIYWLREAIRTEGVWTGSDEFARTVQSGRLPVQSKAQSTAERLDALTKMLHHVR